VKICVFGDARSVHVQRLAAGLSRRGVEVHVVCHKPADVPSATVERLSVPGPSPVNPRGWDGRRRRYLRGFLRRFDVVNVQFLHDWGFTPEIIEAGCFVATAWGSDIVPPPGEIPPSEQQVASRVALLRHADGVSAFGPTFARAVADFAAIDVDRVHLAPLGVDVKLFRPPRSRPSDETGAGTIGFFKGFRVVYNAPCLIRAIPIVLKALPATRFEFVGDGVQLDECKALAGELGVESAIAWIPRQAHHDLPEHLGRWDLTVIPSFYESFGVAALESSAAELPVVASDVGGLRDTVLNGKTGRLVTPNDPAAFARAIVELLENAPLRRQMGRAGRAFVEQQYDGERVMDQWVCLYETALDQACFMV
jgi:glycosyltransferase involved in cell wall biosynthesis